MIYDDTYLAKCDDQAAKAAHEYQDHVHALKIYESVCKDFLAALKMEIRGKFKEKISESELECRARADEKWIKFREEQMEILREAGRREIAYDNWKRRWKTAQSGIALKRAELSRFGT